MMRTPVLHFAELDSTNTEAARRAQTGERGPCWILAARQTAGRGRRGRAWQGMPGNLAATLLLTTDKTPGEAAQMAFVAALALADMAAAFVPHDLIRVKWPNDLLVGGEKAGGILIESGAAPKGGLWLAVGVGANLADAPKDTPYPAASLAAHSGAPSPDEALEALDAGFSRWLAVWEADRFEPIRAAWMTRAHGLGEPCTVSWGDRTITGLNDGLDADGALLLRVDGTVRRITAGDVIFGGA